MWFAGISICLLLLADDGRAGHSPSDPAAVCGLVILAAIIPCLLAAIQARILAVRWGTQARFAERRRIAVQRAKIASSLVWLGLSCGTMLAFSWPSLVRNGWFPGSFPLIDEIVLSLPLAMSAMVAGLILAGIEVGDGLADPGKSSLDRRWTRFFAVEQLRTFFGFVLIPVMILFLVRDLVNIFVPIEFLTMAFGLGGTLFMLLLTAFYPLIAATTWKTSPLSDGGLADELRQTALQRGLRPVPVRVWNTGKCLVNAVVVGLVPGTRRIFLTDELLRQFEQREVCAIFRHELGHIAARHLWLRLLVLVFPILVACLVAATLAEAGIDLDAGASSWPLTALFLAGSAVFWWLVAQPVFRWCEESADRFAILDEKGIPDRQLAEDYCSALLKIAMVHPDGWSRRSMVHPALRTRIQKVAAVAESGLATPEFKESRTLP
jgi:Zn-dependent protease with chaperone function